LERIHEAAFDPALLGPGPHTALELDVTMGNAIVGQGSAAVQIKMEPTGGHVEFDAD